MVALQYAREAWISRLRLQWALHVRLGKMKWRRHDENEWEHEVEKAKEETLISIWSTAGGMICTKKVKRRLWALVAGTVYPGQRFWKVTNRQKPLY